MSRPDRHGPGGLVGRLLSGVRRFRFPRRARLVTGPDGNGPWSGRWARLRLLVLAVAATGLLFGASLVIWPAPDPYQVRPAGVRVLDRNGRLLRGYLSPDQKRRWRLERSQISPALIMAVLQHEDRRFYRHPGIDPLAVMRAAWDNLCTGRVTSGASTLTMQLVRLVEPRPRSIGYKIYQGWRALQYEALYGKDEILTCYLNLAPYGGNIEGVAAAAEVYFGKPAHELYLAEACLLAVLPQAPGRRQPVTCAAAALEARDDLVDKLAARGVITAAEAAEARATPLPDRLHRPPFTAPQFCDRVRGRHPGRANLATTLDRDLQHRTADLVEEHATRLRPRGIEQAAAVVLRAETGEVLAYVASAGFGETVYQGQVDGVVARRSPGSTLKPFAYALAFDRGLATPTTRLQDVPVQFGDYAPHNFDGRFRGVVSAGDALRTSLNVPAVNLAADLARTDPGGLHAFLRTAGTASLDQPADHYGLALVLGAGEVTLLELASLYATLARGGVYQPVQAVLPPVVPPDAAAARATTDPTLLARRVLSPEACWLTLNELTGVKRPQAEALWTGARSRTTVAWKTGTSYGHRDAWSVGVVGPYVVAVWVGNFDGRGAPPLVGSQVAAPLLFAISEVLPLDVPGRWLQRPAGVARRTVCALSGAPAGPHCPPHLRSGLHPRRLAGGHLLGASPAADRHRHRPGRLFALPDPRALGRGGRRGLAAGGGHLPDGGGCGRTGPGAAYRVLPGPRHGRPAADHLAVARRPLPPAPRRAVGRSGHRPAGVRLGGEPHALLVRGRGAVRRGLTGADRVPAADSGPAPHLGGRRGGPDRGGGGAGDR